MRANKPRFREDRWRNVCVRSNRVKYATTARLKPDSMAMRNRSKGLSPHTCHFLATLKGHFPKRPIWKRSLTTLPPTEPCWNNCDTRTDIFLLFLQLPLNSRSRDVDDTFEIDDQTLRNSCGLFPVIFLVLRQLEQTGGKSE